MELGLGGQVAVVIGGANGIGRAIAEGFAGEGAAVAVMDLSPKTPAIAREIGEIGRAAGARTLGLALDAGDYGAVKQAAGRAHEAFGRCDHLVYAAGLGSGKFGFPFWNLNPSDWERVLRVNLLGVVNAAHAFAPAMAEARRGTMLFLSSVAGQIGSQTDPPYSAAKAGVINFAQCAAKDLAPYDVRVNALCPGMVRTAINRAVWEAWNRLQPEEGRMSYEAWAAEKIGKVTPLNRWQEPEEVAAMALFLASDRARSVTGQTLNVDGGQVMHW